MKKITQSATLFNVTLLVLLILFFAACKEEETVVPNPPEEENEFEQPFEDITLPVTTILLNDSSLSNISNLDNNGLVVFEDSNPQLDSVEVGDVMMFGITEKTPYGALRKVIGITPTGNGYSFATVEAKINDAIQDANVEFHKTLVLDDFDSVQLADGITLGNPDGRMENDGLYFNLNFDYPLGENGNAQIKGGLMINPDIDFILEMEYFEVKHFKFTVALNESLEVEETISGVIPVFSEDFTIAKLTGKPIIVSGLIITPIVELEMDIEGNISAGIRTKVAQEGNITLGAEYINGNWTPILARNFSASGEVINPISNASVKVSLGPEFETLFYGVVSVEQSGLTVFAQGAVDLSLISSCWKVDVGLSIQPEIEVEAFGEELEYISAFSAEFPRTVAQGACDAQGTLTGSVVDAINRQPISGVTVTVYNRENEVVDTQSTDAEGNYSSKVTEGDYAVEFEKEGYLMERIIEVNIEANDTQYLDRVLQINEVYDGIGAVAGTIVDATDGSGISGATVTFRRGLSNLSGEVVASTVTGSGGYYQMDGLEAGNYTATIEAVGYISGVISVISIGGQTTFDQNGSLSPELSAGEIRIVLSWGAEPEDLDSHLTGPAADGGRFHVYYWVKQPAGAGAFLDLDDITSYGPETITILETRPGVYRYSVHDYTNRNSINSTDLGRSGARVQVFVGDLDVGTFNVPNQPGTLWTVFELEVDENGELNFTAINNMSYESDEDYIQRRLPTDKHLMQKLPEKE